MAAASSSKVQMRMVAQGRPPAATSVRTTSKEQRKARSEVSNLLLLAGLFVVAAVGLPALVVGPAVYTEPLSRLLNMITTRDGSLHPQSFTPDPDPDRALAQLKTTVDGLVLPRAGIPVFPRFFARDSLLAAFLLEDDVEMLKNVLVFCARHQGTKPDTWNAEEPGKIVHEIPSVSRETPSGSRNTKYNACDTTSLFLIGVRRLQRIFELLGDPRKQDMTVDQEVAHHDMSKALEEITPAIIPAVNYILRHTPADTNLFTESPEFVAPGNRHFMLDVTYWKDSVLINRPNGLPKYPVVYTLAHVQALKAIRSAAELLPRRAAELTARADLMLQAMKEKLFDHEHGFFHIGLDKMGPIHSEEASSDSLHSLYYLEPEDITFAKRIEGASEILATEVGFRPLSARDALYLSDQYHADDVWPFEQAFIHAAAVKHNLPLVQSAALRTLEGLRRMPLNHPFPERLQTRHGPIRPQGSVVQLWTVAAYKYFERIVAAEQGANHGHE